MQFVSITGPKADIDRVVDQYLSRYEIHLENALAQLQTLKTLTPYLQINPYKGLLAKALEYEKLLDSGNIQTNLTMTLDEAVALIESFDQQLTRINEQKKELEAIEGAQVETVTDANDLQAIKVTFDNGILFATNSSQLSASSRDALTKFATSLKNSPETDITIYGHTDNTGTRTVNERISKERAEAVANFLVGNGIARNRITTEGLAFDQPVADNSTAEGRAKNRRVEVYITASANMIKQAEEGTLK